MQVCILGGPVYPLRIPYYLCHEGVSRWGKHCQETILWMASGHLQ